MADPSRQEKMLTMQLLVQQIKQMEKQLEQMESQLQAIEEINTSLQAFLKVKADTPILFPLQNGIFAEARLGESKNLRVNVGADTVVEKTPEETVQLLENQKKEIMHQRDHALKDFQEMVKQVTQLEQELHEH